MSSISHRHRSKSRRRRRHNESLGSPILKFFSPKKSVKTTENSSPGTSSNKTTVTSSTYASSSSSNVQNEKGNVNVSSKIPHHSQGIFDSTNRVRLKEKEDIKSSIVDFRIVAKECNNEMMKNSHPSEILDLTQDNDGSFVAPEKDSFPKIGIMRISQIETKELSPKLFLQQLMEPTNLEHIVPVFTGSIIGRSTHTSGQQSKETNEKKLSLHIPKTLNGISRHHLTALEVRPSQKIYSESNGTTPLSLNDFQRSCPSILWRVNPKAANAIRIHKFRYSHHVNKITRKPIYLKPKFKIELKVGDVIELDWYLFQTNINDALMRRNQGGGNRQEEVTESRQLYRVMPMNVSQSSTFDLPKTVSETELFFTPSEPQDQEETLSPSKLPLHKMNNNVDSQYIQSIVRKLTPNSSSQQIRIMEAEDSQLSKINSLKLSPILKEEISPKFEQSSFHESKVQNETQSTIQGMVTDESSNTSGEDNDKDPMPLVGSRCRALFDVADQFSSIRNHGKLVSPVGWYFGTVSCIDEPNIGIKFDDGEEISLNWRSPHDRKGLELIQKCNNNPSQWEGITSRQLAYETEPKVLYIGDWINVFNALDTSYSRGRVASIHYCTDDKQTYIDVYYDSCEKYECNVSLGKGFIHLVERGFQNHKETNHWLIGLPINIKSGNKRRNRIRMGKISSLSQLKYPEDGIKTQNTNVSEDGTNIICEISFPRNDIETWSYEKVVKELFRNMKQLCEQNGKCTDRMDKNCHREDPPKLAEGYVGVKKIKSDVDSESSNLDEEACSKTNSLNTVHPSLGNSLYRSLNSAEPHIGFGMFMQLANRNFIPNNECFNRVVDIVFNGPTYQGQQFRDANRTNMAFTYTSYLLEKCVDRSSEHVTLQQIEWDKVQLILMLPITQTRRRVTSIKRLSAGLQMSSRALELLSMLFCQDFENLAQYNLETKVKEWGKEKPKMIHSLLQQARASEWLKYAIQCTVKCWLRHGIWVIGTHRFRMDRKKSTKEAIDYSKSYDHSTVSLQTHRCTKFLGRIVKCLTLLYCIEECIELHEQKCCDIIWTTYSNTLSSNDEVGDIDEGSFEDYNNKLKIRFILSCFDADFMKLLRKKLGHAFNVSKELDIITGDSSCQ